MVRIESVIDGEIVQRGPFATENGARMTLANEVEETYASDSTLARRNIQAEIDEAVRGGRRKFSIQSAMSRTRSRSNGNGFFVYAWT